MKVKVSESFIFLFHFLISTRKSDNLHGVHGRIERLLMGYNGTQSYNSILLYKHGVVFLCMGPKITYTPVLHALLRI